MSIHDDIQRNLHSWANPEALDLDLARIDIEANLKVSAWAEYDEDEVAVCFDFTEETKAAILRAAHDYCCTHHGDTIARLYREKTL
jgi:hypothetical protein